MKPKVLHKLSFLIFFSLALFLSIALFTFSSKNVSIYSAPSEAIFYDTFRYFGKYVSSLFFLFYGYLSWIVVVGVLLVSFDILFGKGFWYLFRRTLLLQYLLIVSAVLIAFYIAIPSYQQVGIVGVLISSFLLKYLEKEYWTVLFALLFFLGIVRFFRSSTIFLILKNIVEEGPKNENLSDDLSLWPPLTSIIPEDKTTHTINFQGENLEVQQRPSRGILETFYKYHSKEYEDYAELVPDFLQELGLAENRDIPMYFSKKRPFEDLMQNISVAVDPIEKIDEKSQKENILDFDIPLDKNTNSSPYNIIDSESIEDIDLFDTTYLKNKIETMRHFTLQKNISLSEKEIEKSPRLSFSEGFIDFSEKEIISQDLKIDISNNIKPLESFIPKEPIIENKSELDNILILEELHQEILELQKETLQNTKNFDSNKIFEAVDEIQIPITEEFVSTVDNILESLDEDIQKSEQTAKFLFEANDEKLNIDKNISSLEAIDINPEISIKSDSELDDFVLPIIDDLALNSQNFDLEKEQAEIEATMKMIEDTYQSFNVNVQVVDYSCGPSITRFELSPSVGLKLRTILNLQDDLALQAGTPNIRIVSPLEGRSLIGIEIPNKVRRNFLLREQIDDPVFQESQSTLPLILGVDVGGKKLVIDLATTPHLLIAGTTGSGKSVYVNALIMGLLYKMSFRDLRFIMIDPKMVELELYSGIPHLLAPIITRPEEALAALDWAVQEMDRRYKILSDIGVRNLMEYQVLAKSADHDSYEWLPYIVIIVDEFANLMLRAPKDTEKHIARLASMSRAVGIHLVLATQRPSVDVVTGVIKANFPSRIALRVSSKVDSRTIIDRNGAESLMGGGDMLFMSPDYPNVLRIQAPYVSNDDIKKVVSRLKKSHSPDYVIDFSKILETVESNSLASNFDNNMQDPLFAEVLEFAVDQGEISASAVQRRFRVGYNRASRMIDLMKERGIISLPRSAGKGSVVNISKEEISDFL